MSAATKLLGSWDLGNLRLNLKWIHGDLKLSLKLLTTLEQIREIFRNKLKAEWMDLMAQELLVEVEVLSVELARRGETFGSFREPELMAISRPSMWEIYFFNSD